MKLYFLLIVVLMLSFVGAGIQGAIGIDLNVDKPTFNNNTLSVNNTLYWNGNLWSNTRWLNIDGSNANQNLDIGSYGFQGTFLDIIDSRIAETDGNLDFFSDSGVSRFGNLRLSSGSVTDTSGKITTGATFEISDSEVSTLIIDDTGQSPYYLRAEDDWLKLIYGTNDFLKLIPTSNLFDFLSNGITTTANISASSFFLANTTNSSTGIIYQDNNPFIHSYGTGNLFMGNNTGNFNMSGFNMMGFGDNIFPNFKEGGNVLCMGTGACGKLNDTSQIFSLGASSLANLVGGAGSIVAIGVFSLADLDTGGYITAIGRNSGSGLDGGSSYNVLIGDFIFDNSVASAPSIYWNSIVGSRAAFRSIDNSGISPNRNSIFGARAGYNLQGNGNNFWGYYVGKDELGSNKLYIHNNETSKPLIWGDFLLRKLKINGELNITDGLKITNGSFSLYNDARVTKEVVFKASNSIKGASAPSDSLRVVGESGNILMPTVQFSKVTEQEIYGEFHLPDDIDNTEDVEFHLMWIPGESWTTGNYNWTLEYLVKEEEANMSLGTPTTIYMDVTPDNAFDMIETRFTDTINADAQQIVFAHFYRDVANDNADDVGEVVFFEVKYVSDKLGEAI